MPKSDIYNDQTYLNNNPSWHEEDASFKAQEILALIEANKLKIDNIAEVGCGSGEILKLISDQRTDIEELVGYDISEKAIEIAQKKTSHKLSFACSAISDVIQQNKYDLVLIMDVLEHLENYFKFLEDIRPRGKYTIFHIPLDISLRTILQEKILIESKNRVGHIHNFTEIFILEMLEDTGFDIVDTKFTQPKFQSKSVKQKIYGGLSKLLFNFNQRWAVRFMGGYSILVLTENNERSQ